MNTQRFLAAGAMLATLLLCSVLVFPGKRIAAVAVPGPAIIEGEEEFEYEVSWTVFKLGTIRIVARPDLTALAHIDSYENLPFVDLHSVHSTTMDSLFYSLGSRSLEQRDGGWWGLSYVYDLDNKRIHVEETFQDGLDSPPRAVDVLDTIRLTGRRFVDGLSIAYFPRRFVHTSQTVEVLTVLYGKLGTTTFHFSNEKVVESLDVIDRPVRMVRVDGSTSVVGVFGMTGDFRGWFSDDSVAVPLKGRLKVLLGSVDVELVRWKRGTWNPPFADTGS